MNHFERIAERLRLPDYLNAAELELLRSAAFEAALCNIAFNGLGGCAGVIRAERESYRLRLEHRFMSARARLHHSAGWQRLPQFTRTSAENVFLSVKVQERNFAE